MEKASESAQSPKFQPMADIQNTVVKGHEQKIGELYVKIADLTTIKDIGSSGIARLWNFLGISDLAKGLKSLQKELVMQQDLLKAAKSFPKEETDSAAGTESNPTLKSELGRTRTAILQLGEKLAKLKAPLDTSHIEVDKSIKNEKHAINQRAIAVKAAQMNADDVRPGEIKQCKEELQMLKKYEASLEQAQKAEGASNPAQKVHVGDCLRAIKKVKLLQAMVKSTGVIKQISLRLGIGPDEKILKAELKTAKQAMHVEMAKVIQNRVGNAQPKKNESK